MTESADYAAEFNANLTLRERLRQGGLMQANQGRPGSPHGLSMSASGVGLTRLPHLHEQAIDGYSILIRALLRLYAPTAAKEAEDAQGIGWNRTPVVEKVFVR